MAESLSELIGSYIERLIEESGGVVLLRRKELASRFGCVPSQINYVIKSRFSAERGYLVESQRGEYGFIKITKVSFADGEERLRHLESLFGDIITEEEASRILAQMQERGLMTPRERLLVEVALSGQDAVLRDLFDVPSPRRGLLRARLLRALLRALCLC